MTSADRQWFAPTGKVLATAAAMLIVLLTLSSPAGAQALSGTTQVSIDDSFLNAPHRCACPAMPLPACLQAGFSRLMVRDRSSGEDVIAWLWAQGVAMTTAQLGDPTIGTSYNFCVYDHNGGSPTAIVDTVIPAGARCCGQDCWRDLGSKFLYVDCDASRNGLGRVATLAGAAGESVTRVVATSSSMPTPGLPLIQDPAVIVQLSNSSGTCWESSLTAPAKRSSSEVFMDTNP